MASRARPPSLELLDPTAVSPNGFVQLFILTLLNQVRENLQHTPCTTLEGELRDREVTPGDASQHRSPLVDYPESPKRKAGGHGGGS